MRIAGAQSVAAGDVRAGSYSEEWLSERALRQTSRSRRTLPLMLRRCGGVGGCRCAGICINWKSYITVVTDIKSSRRELLVEVTRHERRVIKAARPRRGVPFFAGDEAAAAASAGANGATRMLILDEGLSTFQSSLTSRSCLSCCRQREEEETHII